ncbi:MAG: 6-phosphogluconolactonase [Pyrinomonadaceae bacterium]
MEAAAKDNAPQIIVCDDAADVARRAADRIIEIARAAIEATGRFSIALGGGSTPKKLYELLASDDYRNEIEWEKVHIFFGDERCVPPDDEQSNYRMANEAMLARVPLPQQNIHRMIGEGDAVANARLYEDELRSYFEDETWPRFDVVLLGMGDDGHTASLFPGSLALQEQTAWVASNWVEKFNTFRITLSAPAINHAAHVMFLITGAGKAERLPEVINGARDTNRLPSQLIQPQAAGGALEWLVDKDAAANL